MWSWQGIRNWLTNVFNQVTANLIAAGILALLAILFAVVVAYVPVIDPYLRTPLPIPAWVLLSVALVLVLTLIIHRRQLTRRPVPTPTPPPPPEPTRTPKPPDFYPFSHFDVDWEIMPHFLSAFRTVENPSRGSLDEFIKGPFCPQCHRLLRLAIEGTWLSAGVPPIYKVENPCPTCGRRHPDPNIQQFDLHEIKAEVYKEAQRLARDGQFPSKKALEQ